VVFAALTSAISVLEVLVATVVENFQISRGKSTILIASAVFILAIPNALAESGTLFKNWSLLFNKNFFDTLSYLTDSWLLPINALFTAIFAGWVYDKAQREDSFKSGTTMSYLFIPWLFLVRWVVPIGVLLIFLQETGLININKLF
jgi:NSS family neurotransmitter:Na+ symporter